MATDADPPALEILETEVEVTAIRAQGAGGQNVNKVSIDSFAEGSHTPTSKSVIVSLVKATQVQMNQVQMNQIQATQAKATVGH